MLALLLTSAALFAGDETTVSEGAAEAETRDAAAGDEEAGDADAGEAVRGDTLAGDEEAGAVVTLAPGGEALGVRRHEPVDLAPGMDHDAPAVAVTESGKVVVVFVSRAEDDTETIMVREAASPEAELGPARAVSAGARAWNPALAAGPEGSVWLSWCGRFQPDERGDHDRSVYLRRLLPAPMGEPVRASQSEGRSCDPAIDVGPDGRVHLAWEARDRIAYRSFSSSGEPLGETAVLSKGPLDRRPSVLAGEGEVHVAWDRLDPTVRPGARDPRYDLLLRTRREAAGEDGFGDIVEVDARDGIQAAPALAWAPGGGGVLVAYHSSDRHPLVKWWRLRQVSASGDVVELALPDPAGERAPEGEQQGAELPDIALGPGGRLAVVTRPSQGAYLHLIDAEGVSPPLDLTRRGWGARGARTRVVFAPDGTLLVVRRARHTAVLERFDLAGPASGPPPFRAVEAASGGDAMAPDEGWRGAAGAARPADAGVLGSEGSGRRILLGDVHMHSALSDGTGPADEVYARARVRGMDFAVLTDHDYIVGSRMFPSKHAEIVWITDWFDALDGFATLHGFEWTTPPLPRGHGHRNVYFRGHPMTPQPGSRDGYPDTASLNRVLRDEQAFTAAHHTAWTGTDWENFDPKVQRHVEIVSVHGAFERSSMEEVPIEPRGEHEQGLVVHGLAAGHVFGFLGGSDAHGLRWHHGLGRRADPWDHGLTGVVATELSRAAIWDAMHARLTYATSGAPMVLRVSVSGVAMGGEGRAAADAGDAPATTAPVVRWSYETSEDPVYLMVIRDGEPVHRSDLKERVGSGSWTDESARSGRHGYYVRLVQGEGEAGVDVAWSSPVFVEIGSR